MRRLAFAFAALIALAAPTLAFAEDKIVVFAAASLKTALDAAATNYHSGGGPEVAISYGGSLALARQIVAGAPADIFASADEASMDEAEKGKAIRDGSRFDLLTNHIVFVAPKTAALTTLTLDRDSLVQAIGSGHVATGEVNTVPVGKYAKAALTKLGLWDAIEPHLAMTDNVRAALGFVSRGEAALGIVYATDANAEPAVKIVATIPDDSHPPIRYPFAIAASSHNPAADKFIAYLKSEPARAIFTGQGFGVLP